MAKGECDWSISTDPAASSLGTHCDQPSDVLHRASPHHAGTIPPNCEQKETLPSVASLKYFISAMRKVTNTKVCSPPPAPALSCSVIWSHGEALSRFQGPREAVFPRDGSVLSVCPSQELTSPVLLKYLLLFLPFLASS